MVLWQVLRSVIVLLSCVGRGLVILRSVISMGKIKAFLPILRFTEHGQQDAGGTGSGYFYFFGWVEFWGDFYWEIYFVAFIPEGSLYLINCLLGLIALVA